ncbi:MAG: DUF1587 domain-containing protein, partial [Pseudomonadales bacterium]|nr:DUF1587 domain-containing protein [Pseudomonadales bacterium]
MMLHQTENALSPTPTQEPGSVAQVGSMALHSSLPPAGEGLVLAIAGAALLVTSLAASAAETAPASEQALFGSHDNAQLLDDYCLKCHNSEDWLGQLAFDLIDHESVAREAQTWEKVIRKLSSGMMPPPGNARPDKASIDALVRALQNQLDQVEQPRIGQVPLHRLNRTEYANAVGDLLGLSVDPEALLPVDGVEDSFDKIASALKVSPTFIDQYVSAARTLSEQAVGSLQAKPQSVIYAVAAANQTTHVTGLPLGTRGGAVVEHYFPVDGEYLLNIGDLVSTGGSVAQ